MPMPQSELIRTLDPPGLAASPSGAVKATTPDVEPIASPPDIPIQGKGVKPTCPDSPPYFGETLVDAERLLKYAAEAGVDVDEDIRDHILQARAAGAAAWEEATAANLLTALTKLAARLKPVTAESLKACSDSARLSVHNYWWVALCLAMVIVPFSVASFVASAISTAIRADIATANDLAVKLRVQLGPPTTAIQGTASTARTPGKATSALPTSTGDATVITQLQQLATSIRAIDARGRQLNVLLLWVQTDPFEGIRKNPTAIHDTFELPKGLPDLPNALYDRIMVYQDVRYFAQSLLDDVSFFYGAVTTCLLPVLYALLGTCAYLLRTLEQQMTTRTFTPSVANSARFLIAAIGGAVVGLFGNFTIGQGASIPPLAIAFLVGYAVDVFFAFLENMLQTFSKNTISSPSPTASSGAKP
jgi:hypothetical protein